MDDMNAIRDLLSAPPARPEVIEAGRARLATAFDPTPLRSLEMPDQPSHLATRRSTAKRKTARWAALGTGLLGAAAAVTLLMTSGAPPVTPDASTSASAPLRLSAKDVLLAAASSVATSRTDGAYWVRRAVTGKQRQEPGGRYTLQLTTAREAWMSPGSDEPMWWINQELGAKPATPEDERAWRAAGSPTTWTYPGKTVTRDGKPFVEVPEITLRGGPGERVATRDASGKAMTLLGRPMRADELAELPTTPEALREYLKDIVTTAYGAERIDLDAELFAAGVKLTMNYPVSPQVQAAAYRMLAALPGVTALGEVTDPLGRAGQAVSSGMRRGGELTFVVDAGTGQPLALLSTIKNGGAEHRSYEAIKQAGWTDERPDLPAERR
ncbi:CU044_5270 family protein [Nonomuraea sp. NN258]|uniref:CU044_5270 family protein n=1 Tax=Nonomuraea antri TaxID=2730852 RepID=UPI00156A2160|nr:CU044_5270 family protein [Nonomuraea antri]NRQ37125.1 CU044_5270 family protein [Nonomuraea antri]